MRVTPSKIVVLALAVLTIVSYAETATKQNSSSQNRDPQRCGKMKDGRRVCFCGRKRIPFDRFKGERCINGQVTHVDQIKASSRPQGLRLTAKPIHQSTRDNKDSMKCGGLQYKPSEEARTALVPLQNVSVEAWIDAFAADVLITQVFVNREKNPIEAIYVFPIEENAAVYSFTAEIDDRTITAVVKEKKVAEQEYKAAVDEGKTSILMRQSQETLDTFTVNVGALPAGKECRIKIRYVTELDLVEENSIRFVVPTTIAARYNPSLGYSQSPDQTPSEYVQKTPYTIWFEAHVLRGSDHKINQVANLSHPVNVSLSAQSIDVSSAGIALDRDIIIDIDLPENRPLIRAIVEHQHNDPTKYAVALAFTPRASDIAKIVNDSTEVNTEFIFIVDCSGSMMEENRIGLAREAMLLFIRSLPVGSHFNIIRFGSHFDIHFKQESLTTVYDESTAKSAEELTRSMEANFGGTEILSPLQKLKEQPPVNGRSRQIFLLTDGEVSNTNQVIDLCRSMSSNTRIFSFGIGYSSSRSLVKGLARATNGYFVFIPPNSKVDSYVGSQLARALQPSLIGARLEWHGLTVDGMQAPETIPPLYVNDRILVYETLKVTDWKKQNINADLVVHGRKVSSIKLVGSNVSSRDTIRRLAAKALIQELQHKKSNTVGSEGESEREQRITSLSLAHQILSSYTAFVGVETTSSTAKDVAVNKTRSVTRYVPIQISKGDEHLFAPMVFSSGYYGAPMGPQFMAAPARGPPYFQHMNKFPMHQQGLPGSPAHPPVAFFHDVAAPTTSTAKSVSFSSDPVRWLIHRQSFNGAWQLNVQDVEKLTNGKQLSKFTSKITKSTDALTTALAIAVLESKYADQKMLWNAVVAKGRKQLINFGLHHDQVDLLIDEIKNQL